MSIGIVKTQKNSSGFSIWFDNESCYKLSDLLELLAPINIISCTRVLESFGPAEFIDEISTKKGVFSMHQEFDDFSGSTIYSESTELMNEILKLMLASGQYYIR